MVFRFLEGRPDMADSTTIGCLLISHFRARVELGRRAELGGLAGVIVDRSGSRPVVVDCLPAASEVEVGMTLEQALALQPEAVVLESDEPHYAREFERLLDGLDEVSDRVEGADHDGELGVVYVGLDGLEAMYGGEGPMLEALLTAVPERFQPRVGIGPNKFAAFIAARTRRSAGLSRVDGSAAAFLAPHSVDLLPASLVPPELLADLHRLGLHRMGDVAGQEMHALLDRFGHEGQRAWELASGIDERPLRPRVAEESIAERVVLPEGSASLELLRVAVDTLLTRVFAQPRMQGRYAGTATLVCELEDAPTEASSWQKEFHFKQRIGNWRRAAEIIGGRLETEHPPAPVEAMTVTLGNLSGATGVQLSLFPDIRADRERRLLETERQLQARLQGKHALHRLVEVAPWHPAPEMRTVQVSIDPAATDSMRPLTSPRSVEVREGPAQEPRAVRLGNQWQEVSSIEDRWSFDLWWRPTPMQRSYYRVSQADGQRLTIYRDGGDQRWYRQTA
ncbi:MAG: DNA polymerase Y family protein [Chloroflexota bacterium]|nr:DNA polymerase Y family protein [Chloroflexota bacterium]MDE2893851.1 DNA polymerase Y family protein [Chloroflexota bacterium]